MPIKTSNIPKKLEMAAGSKIHVNVSDEQMKKINIWCKNPEGNFFIYGDTGRGKSYIAVALMYFLNAKKNIPWFDQYFISVSELNQQWLALEQNEKYGKSLMLREKSVLVLDDLGIKSPSDAFLEFLFTVIDYRCNHSERVTIYTTNLNSQELNANLGPRIISRITDGIKIKVEGKDLRLEF